MSARSPHYNAFQTNSIMDNINIGTFLIFDPLSIFFLLVIAVVSVPSAVYSIGYMRHEYPSGKIAFAWVLLSVFVFAMASVVSAGNLLFFLIAWEIMSLVSYFLVVFDHESGKSISAGTIYIIMTHIGTAFIIFAFLLLYRHAGSLDIAVIKNACRTMPGSTKDLIFILLLLGFGTKAGIVPLHIWLPLAHPQAPSHISSIMSGVMIKTAIYGLLRFAVFMLGVNALWWGYLVLVVASVSCLVGVIYALMEQDLKKLLAYSSVENIGIILLGIGGCMVFLKMEMPVPAVLSLTAGLYHTINHAIFKGLLFLCAGSVYKSTGTRDMEKLGGLIKTMPWTAAAFLAGALAISAIPPFNGFVSEWLTLQALFAGALNGAGIAKISFGIFSAVLALTGGLAAYSFVKAFGITFLAMPRSQNARETSESVFSMKAAMVFLAVLTAVFGLGAAVIIGRLSVVSGYVAGIDASAMNFTLNNFIVVLPAKSAVYLSPPVIALILTGAVGLTLAIIYFVLGRRKASVNKTWDCGYYKLDSRTEYTATAFSKPFRIAFGFFLLPYRKKEKIWDTYYHVKSFRYEVHTTQIFSSYVYEPAVNAIFKTAGYLRRIQPGSIHVYIAYIFITILLLIVFMNRF